MCKLIVCGKEEILLSLSILDLGLSDIGENENVMFYATFLISTEREILQE